MISRLFHRGMLLGGLVAAGALAAACGGSGSPGVADLASTTTTSSAAVPAGGPPGKGPALLVSYVHCMRAHGEPDFPMPFRTADGYGISIGPGTGVNPRSPKFQSAQASCRHLLPAKGQGPTITPADQADYLKGAACMRAHGYPSFPDPAMTSHSVQFNVPSSIDQSSTKFREAVTTCEKLIPAGLPYSGTS